MRAPRRAAPAAAQRAGARHRKALRSHRPGIAGDGGPDPARGRGAQPGDQCARRGAPRALLRNVLGPGIEKRFDLTDQELPVMADPTQLEVAVLNLAINARDAMPEGGVLTFATRRAQGTNDPEPEEGGY